MNKVVKLKFPHFQNIETSDTGLIRKDTFMSGMLKKIIFSLTVCFCTLSWAAQNTDYVTTQIPIGVKSDSDTLWVKWTGGTRIPPVNGFYPDSGIIYFDKNPGTSLADYRYTITPLSDPLNSTLDASYDNGYIPQNGDTLPRRGIAFVPEQQTGMEYGVYYCVIALPTENDTLFSNTFQIAIQSPVAVDMHTEVSNTITDLTPTFSWDPNPDAPYYHIILSDERINIDSTGIEGLSIVWQAITPETEIVYGDPDPSGTMTSPPPPLSPGQEYTWVVLNNYGNNILYSSTVINIPLIFDVAGDSLARPVNVYPVDDTLNNIDNETFEFKWTNLDSNANTYQIYVYTASDFEGVDAQLVVWNTEVTAGGFTDDTGRVSINANSILTSNTYTWKVMAIDDKGAATGGALNTFRYTVPTGTMLVYTKEKISAGGDTIESNVGLVEISVEVLDGSMEAALAFYTDDNGYLSRERPVGTYRLTAKHPDFEEVSKTVSISENQTTPTTIFLERPAATILGKVLSSSGLGINLATVTGVSDRGDTLTTETDALGNFSFNCYGADWTVWASKTGYISSDPVDITIADGERKSLAAITIAKNPINLTGVVVNDNGDELIGAKVELYSDGQLIDQEPSTAQDGAFAFSLSAGTYILRATKLGFSGTEDTLELASSQQITMTLSAGAAVVTGAIYGRSLINSEVKVAAITNARITLLPIDTSNSTYTTQADAQYGRYSLSLPGTVDSFWVVASAEGFITDTFSTKVTTGAGITIDRADTLQGLARMYGYAKMSDNNAGISDARISLYDTLSGEESVSAMTQSDGYFEIRNISDGVYTILVGKEGLVLDSVGPDDTIRISNGLPDIDSVTTFMSAGTKNIWWVIDNGDDVTSAVKVLSPLQKTLGAEDSLKNVGPGTYTVSIDAVDPSIIDLATHRFTVDTSDAEYVDSVQLPISHTKRDTSTLVDDSISITLTSTVTLDRATIYFRGANKVLYDSVVDINSRLSYTFKIKPKNDGVSLRYYFKAYRGTDVYGYNKETFSTYIKPDRTKISKYDIIPGLGDTLIFPSNCDIAFRFKGYYSSSFLPINSYLPERAISSWRIINGQGCDWYNNDSTGLSVAIMTGEDSTESPVGLELTIDNSVVSLQDGLSSVDTVFFRVSGTDLVKISVSRVDGDEQLTNTENAEFAAKGFNSDSNEYQLAPRWSVTPENAGEISVDGVFSPDSNFVGFVRIYAQTGNTRGEYKPAVEGNERPAGLSVGYFLTSRAVADTVSNNDGCTLVFPDSIVDPSDNAVLTVTSPSLQNLMNIGKNNLFLVGEAYDLDLSKSITFNVSGGDSIELVLAVPQEQVAKVAAAPETYFIGFWNEDSLQWEVDSSSIVAEDGSTIRKKLAHFSRYAIIGTAGKLSAPLFVVTPNPFSPYVKPQHIGYDTKYGTCFRFSLNAPELNPTYAWIRVYNNFSELVYSVKMFKPTKGETYHLWWDGKTTDGTINISIADINSEIPTNNMCRNGRYFAVLTIKSDDGSEKNYTKPVVLFK